MTESDPIQHIESSTIPDEAVVEPIVEPLAAIADAEALPPTNVVTVPTEEQDVPMTECEAPKKNDEPAVVQDDDTKLTEQIKKTDSDAGDEPKIVGDEVGDSQDVDMADVAVSAVNGGGDKLVDGVKEPAVELEKADVDEKTKQVSVTIDETVVATGKSEEEDKIIAYEAPAEVEGVIEEKVEPNVDADTEHVEKSAEVLDEVSADGVVEPIGSEKTDIVFTESEPQHSEAVVAVAEANTLKLDDEKNDNDKPISADSQLVTSSDLKLTNGNSEVATEEEVPIPITIEQSDASSSTTDSSTSPAILSTSSETNELTETTSTDLATGKEKVSRVEITIEKIEKLPGQTTQTTTTHIVKEITIKEQQHVVSAAKTENAEAKKVSTDVSTNEQLNGQPIKSGAVEHIAISNGKELAAVDTDEKNGDDSDKENEVSTTNGSGTATADAELLGEAVLKKCAPTVAATDPSKPIEAVPDVTA